MKTSKRWFNLRKEFPLRFFSLFNVQQLILKIIFTAAGKSCTCQDYFSLLLCLGPG